MDLADFPQLRELDLFGTCVTGDIRDINGSDFPALQQLKLPQSVRGGSEYEFQSVAEVPHFMHAFHRLLQQRTPTFFGEWGRDRTKTFGWCLSRDSPDWYELDDGSDDGIDRSLYPPLYLKCFQVGPRFGWCWHDPRSCHGLSCEINWLNPEPIEGSDDYEVYNRELQHAKWFIFHRYKGYFLSPPNAAEFHQITELY